MRMVKWELREVVMLMGRRRGRGRRRRVEFRFRLVGMIWGCFWAIRMGILGRIGWIGWRREG